MGIQKTKREREREHRFSSDITHTEEEKKN
jgi:hypothetical protein